PGLGGLRHQSHDHDTAEKRALNEQLVAEAIADPAPERCTERDDGGRHTERDPGPERDFSGIGDTELLDIPGQEWHHQREAGEANEGRGDDRDLIAAPVCWARGVHTWLEAYVSDRSVLAWHDVNAV